jgi:hypothetical protein
LLQIDNRTIYPASLIPSWNPQGHESVLAVVKSTYAICAGNWELAPCPSERQAPVQFQDVYHGEPGRSSMRVESDLALVKPQTDVIVNGSAYAPPGRAVGRVDVEVRVAEASSALCVTGDRHWVRGLAGFYATQPDRFERMPVVYERAFGGSDGDAMYHPNPVGCGFHASRQSVSDSMLPNVEVPHQLISRWDDRPAPGGFGIVDRYWQARVAFAGTYDDHWHKERLPYLPADFDPRFFQAASVALRIAHPRGGEDVALLNLHPDGLLRFRLAIPKLMLLVHHAQRRSEVHPVVDTIVIEPDEMRVVLTSRALIACDGSIATVKEVLVTEAGPTICRAFLAGKRIVRSKGRRK